MCTGMCGGDMCVQECVEVTCVQGCVKRRHVYRDVCGGDVCTEMCGGDMCTGMCGGDMCTGMCEEATCVYSSQERCVYPIFIQGGTYDRRVTRILNTKLETGGSFTTRHQSPQPRHGSPLRQSALPLSAHSPSRRSCPAVPH